MIYIAYSDKCVHYEIWKAPASCWSLSKGQLLWDITLCLVVVVFFCYLPVLTDMIDASKNLS